MLGCVYVQCVYMYWCASSIFVTLKINVVKKSRLLLTEICILMYEIKIEDVYEEFSKNKEMFDFCSYSDQSKYYDDASKLALGKMKEETGGVAIEEFVRLKSKMYSFLLDDNSEHEKTKRHEWKSCCKNKL